MLDFWQTIVLIGIVSLSMLLSFLLAAWAVFRTKRESHEGFFTAKPGVGKVFSIDDVMGTEEMPEGFKTVEERIEDYPETADRMREFGAQFSSALKAAEELEKEHDGKPES